MRDRLVVGSFNDADKIVGTQRGILRHHLAAKVSNLFIDRLQAIGILMQGLTSFRGQCAQQNIGCHWSAPFPNLQSSVSIFTCHRGASSFWSDVRTPQYRPAGCMGRTSSFLPYAAHRPSPEKYTLS